MASKPDNPSLDGLPGMVLVFSHDPADALKDPDGTVPVFFTEQAICERFLKYHREVIDRVSAGPITIERLQAGLENTEIHVCEVTLACREDGSVEAYDEDENVFHPAAAAEAAPKRRARAAP